MKNRSLKNKLFRKIVMERPQFLACRDKSEKLDMIRDWVYENTILAGETKTHSDKSAELYIRELVDGQETEYGYYCGGIASVCSYIYNYLGFRSCTLDMAIRKNGVVKESHVVTLVRVKEKWIVEDATFNITYVNEEKEHLDIYSLRNCLTEGKNVTVKPGATPYRKLIRHTEGYYSKYDYDRLEDGDYEKNGFYYFLQNTDINKFLRMLDEDAVSVIKGDGYELNEAIMYLYPYQIYVPDNYIRDNFREISKLRTELMLP